MKEFVYEGNARRLVIRYVPVGMTRGWRVCEAGAYLFQFASKAKATAYAKGLTGAKRMAKDTGNERGLK